MNSLKLVNLISELFGLPKYYDSKTEEVEFNCPFCDQGRNKFNLVVNTYKLAFHCWSCDYKGQVGKLFYNFGSEEQKAEFFNKSWKRDYRKFTRKPPLKDHIFPVESFRSMKVVWRDSLDFLAAKNYLKGRKISKILIDQWDICYSEFGEYAGRIIIPSKDIHGKIEYFVARDFYGTSKIKYKNPKLEKNNVIFGEKFIDWTKPVILTEGVFDAMVLYNSVPLLGTKIDGYTKLHKKIIENKTPIIIGFDEDKIGKTERIKVAKFLEKLGSRLYIIKNNKYNDLASAHFHEGKKYLISLIKNAVPFDELELKIELLED